MLRYLVRRCHGEVALAEDLAGETFARATRAFLGRRGDDGTAAGWLLAIARSVHLDHLRRRLLPVAEVDGELLEASARPQADEVDALLAELPPRAARLLRLVHLDGFTAGEVAAMTGQRPEAVRTALWRARAMFRTAWEESER